MATQSRNVVQRGHVRDDLLGLDGGQELAAERLPIGGVLALQRLHLAEHVLHVLLVPESA